MATMTQTQDTVAEYTGYGAEHVREIGNALAEAWDAPAADGANYPELQPRYVARLLLALAANASPANAMEIADRYSALQDTNTVPNSVLNCGEMIEAMLLTHYSSEGDKTAQVAYRSSFEVCHSQPGVRMTTETTDGPKHVVFLGHNLNGTLLAFSEFREVMRRSYTIDGKTLHRIATNLKHTGPIHRVTVPFQIIETA